MNRLVILGAGESGTGAALLAKAKGFDVFVSDKGAISDHYKSILVQNDISFEENQHTESLILNADEVIKSPGIPDKAELIKKLAALRRPIISEIEFAARYTSAKLIAITGSNGKTTTTMLVYHILKTAGYNVGLGGNIGESFAKQVLENSHDYYVLELSSFQLDNCFSFHAHIAILLNITPDHLDRYDYNFQNYVESKFRITQNQTSEDTFIYFAENEPSVTMVQSHEYLAQQLTISLVNEACTAYAKAGVLNFGEDQIDTNQLPLKGPHNALNMMAAGLAAHTLGIDYHTIETSFKTFRNAPHRLEKIAEINGVTYINDSKATNVDSVFYALGSFNRPIVLIMGGVDKGNDYSQIETLVKEKIKTLICMGVDNSKLQTFFEGKVPNILSTHTLAEALEAAKSIALAGDIVLLSPACASFDLFKNYMDRGDQFREKVLGWVKI